MRGLYAMAWLVKRSVRMSPGFPLAAAVTLLLGCRGEPVPHDYQNTPPAVTHPVTSSGQTPTAHGMPGAAPEPTSGVEGKNVGGQPTSATERSATLPDQAPSGSTATSVSNPDPHPPPGNEGQTTHTVITGTHLATKP
jgi:hypothetical protein